MNHWERNLFLDLYVEHSRVVVFFERLVGVVLPGLVVVLEELQHHFLEWDGLSVFTVFLDVLTRQPFYLHHPQHHGEVEVDIEQILFPLDADDSGGVELEILYFDGLHFGVCLWPQNCKIFRNAQ